MFSELRNLYFFGGVAAALTTGLYILLGPSQKQRNKKKVLCRGLENLGNTCFLNAILQAWAATRSIIDWLSEFTARKDVQHAEDYLATSILKTLKVLNYEEETEGDVYSPVDVLSALRHRRWIITTDEQDAHELFHVLTQTLGEETMKYPTVLPLFDLKSLENTSNGYQPMGAAITRSRGLLPVLPNKGVDQPFRGLLASQLQCKDCGYKHPVKYDMIDSLSLTFPQTPMPKIDLSTLLRRYVTSEIVPNVECPSCQKKVTKGSDEKENVCKTACLKKLTIGKLPQCLCIHLQRTRWLNNGMPVKRFDHVIFPEVLHMDEFVYTSARKKEMDMRNGLLGGNDFLFLRNSSSSTSLPTSRSMNLLHALNYDSRTTSNGLFLQDTHLSASVPNNLSDINHNGPSLSKHSQGAEYSYKLTSVVTHLGDVYSGHFVSHRRRPSRAGHWSNKWLCVSDCSVKCVELEDILDSEAYMLFYERIPVAS